MYIMHSMCIFTCMHACVRACMRARVRARGEDIWCCCQSQRRQQKQSSPDRLLDLRTQQVTALLGLSCDLVPLLGANFKTLIPIKNQIWGFNPDHFLLCPAWIC